ncbi:putative damage-inducible protein DinB [Pseudomonas sp. AG1028]|uniref:DinB family protein n=1 Tax=Pseudomonas sp. AG1028 TaxID=2572911 RepID=UPI0011ABE09B|nr:DinB family protein [Pseudomonas sp. AG1028]TWE05337.1 putative damage-inducible protein DinB [Pseudomonas sp. AG1028]
MLFADAFKYKKWANEELLALGERQLEQLSEKDAEFFIRILNHTTVVDSLFISRLSGEAECYSGDNTRETPTFDELRARIAQNDAWLVTFAERATAEELQRVIVFRFTDGDLGQLSVEEVLLHLLTHGSNHRGMAARTLAINGLERPKDTFTRYLYQAQPGRRETARQTLG